MTVTKTPERFPILHSHRNRSADLLESIPWGMIAPHQAQALKNHDQTLARLAERGGLSPSETIDVIAGRKWTSDKRDERAAESRLRELVALWEARPASSTETDADQ